METKGGTACQKGILPSPGDTAWTDGSKTHHGAGWAVVTPTFQEYGRLTGPQTSYRGEFNGVLLGRDVLKDGTIVLDNGGALSAVQLFGRLAVLETHGLRS